METNFHHLLKSEPTQSPTFRTSIGTWVAGGRLAGWLTLMAGVWLTAPLCWMNWAACCFCRCSRRSCSCICSRMSCCRSKIRDVILEELSGGLEAPGCSKLLRETPENTHHCSVNISWSWKSQALGWDHCMGLGHRQKLLRGWKNACQGCESTDCWAWSLFNTKTFSYILVFEGRLTLVIFTFLKYLYLFWRLYFYFTVSRPESLRLVRWMAYKFDQ